jgi:hypothetical protein
MGKYIEKFKAQYIEKEKARAMEEAQMLRESADNQVFLHEFISKYLIPAEKSLYEKWLKAWLDAGNTITHYHDYSFHHQSFYTAKSDFVLDQGLYGSLSLKIIVPKGINYSVVQIGHCNIYDLNTMRHPFRHFIPAYSDLDI